MAASRKSIETFADAGRACVVLAAVLSWLASPSAANSRYDPSLRFRSLTTPHFVIYFHQGEGKLAARLSTIAEQVHGILTRQLGMVPRGRTHVVLVDQTDQAGGWATPTPRNTIELSVVWPHATETIGNTDDWLTLVFAHEYTHILQLDRSEAWAAGVRRLFGRVPLAFPNLYLPRWQIEGLATYEESRVTGRGRVDGGDFSMLVDEAARASLFEPLDRVSGGLIDWPSETAAYAYGAYFHQYLANRFGEAALEHLTRRTARSLPYTGTRAFKRVFGQDLGELWRDFMTRRRESAREVEAGPPAPTRLTHHGFVVAGPRFLGPSVPSGTSARAPERLQVVYSVRNPDGFPSLFSTRLDGSSPIRIAERFGGERATASQHAIYFDQLELTRNVSLHSDLYELNRATGRLQRLTRGARLSDPDLSPAGDALACIVVRADRRDLVRFDVAHRLVRVIVSQPDAQFSWPRWSPDGRFIAVARQRLHDSSEIVLVNAQSGDVSVVASRTRGRLVTPVWTPDGRTILFASDRDGRFNLHAVDLDDQASTGEPVRTRLWQVTRLPGGATAPDIAPDGRTIVYVGYTPEGFDLFTIPFDRSTWRIVDDEEASAEPLSRQSQSAAPHTPPNGSAAGGVYRPFRTLLPYYWLPVIEVDDNEVHAGIATGGTDVLGRHAYTFSADWPIRRASESAFPGRPEWHTTYLYDRWQPTFFVTASAEISDVIAPGASEGSVPASAQREKRRVGAGVSVPFRQVRSSHYWLSAFDYERCAFCGNGAAVQHRPALRFGWMFSNAREYGYSISRDQGLIALVTTEHVRRALGASGDTDAITAETRGFLPVGAPHTILAVRAGAAMSSGDQHVRRLFELGGSGPDRALLGFGGGPLRLLRGFSRNAFSGRHVVLLNLDYRIPFVRPERGHGTLPVFLRTVHGSVFLDAGHAWDQAFSARNVKTSAGLELSCDLVVGHSFPLTLASGLAWGRDGQTGASRLATYLRVGRAF